MKSLELHLSNDKSVLKPSEILKKITDSIDPIGLVILVLHKWPIIVVTVVICTGLSYWNAKSADYIYRAGARVEVFHENRLKDKGAETDYDRLERSASRHIIIMSGEMFHRELVAKLRIKWKEQMTDNELRVPFKINPVRGSGLRGGATMIDLSVDSKSPEYALDYLQSILGAYRDYRKRELGQINKDAIAGLRGEEERIQSGLTDIRREIAQFEFENKVLVAREREQMQDSVVNDLIGRLQMIRTERLLLEDQYKEIVDSDLTTISETLKVNQNPQIREFLLSQQDPQSSNQNPPTAEPVSSTNNLQTVLDWEGQENLLIYLENKYQQQIKAFKAGHPKMKELEIQIDTLKSNLERQLETALKRFQSSYQALKRKEDAIERVTENIQTEKMLSPTKESEYLRLKNHEAQLQRKYELVYERILSSTGAIDGFSFITIQEPYIYRDPIAPDKVKLLAIGPFAGLFIGIAFVLIRWFVVPIAIVLLKEFRQYYKASVPTAKY